MGHFLTQIPPRKGISLDAEVTIYRAMRYNIIKKHSTKTERMVYEVLKEKKIPFKHRWIIGGREIDFVIGKICIEIDGHEQDGKKNHILAELGYIPIHLHNSEITRENIIKLLNEIK